MSVEQKVEQSSVEHRVLLYADRVSEIVKKFRSIVPAEEYGFSITKTYEKFSFIDNGRVYVMTGDVEAEDNASVSLNIYQRPEDITDINLGEDPEPSDYLMTLGVGIVRDAVNASPWSMDFFIRRTKKAIDILPEPINTYDPKDTIEYKDTQQGFTTETAQAYVTFNSDGMPSFEQIEGYWPLKKKPVNDLGLSVVSQVVHGIEESLKLAEKNDDLIPG